MQQVVKRGLLESLEENIKEQEEAGIGGHPIAFYSTPEIAAVVEQCTPGHYTLYWRLMVMPNNTIIREQSAQQLRLLLNDLGIPLDQGWVSGKQHEDAMETLCQRFNVAFTNKYKKS